MEALDFNQALFKISDPTLDKENKNNRLYKVAELFEYFIGACKANYRPNMCIALDEAVKKFKGRCIFKQYIKNKPVRWGIKIFCVCCSATSYLWNASFYVGKKEEDEDRDKDASVTQSTVVKLLEPLSGKNHRVYMDNYYTSIPLFNELLKMEIFATGTVRTNGKGLDRYVTMKKEEERNLKKNPGLTRFSSYGRLVYAAWFDKRAVHVLSNCHQPVGDDTVDHWFTAKKGEKAQTASGKILKKIPICPIVRSYRLWMGAVDTFDQFRSYIKLEMRTGKFWHVMFWFILESALVNAWILYRVSRELALLEVEYTHFQFRVAIALALAQEWEDMGCVFRPEAQTTGVASPRTLLKRGAAHKVRVSFGAEASKRSTPNDMHASYLEKIPLREGGKSAFRQLVCIYKNCPKKDLPKKQRRVSRWCRECAAPLCAPECFLQFHAQK